MEAEFGAVFGLYYGTCDEAMESLTVEQVRKRIRHGASITGLVSFKDDDEDDAPDEEKVVTGRKLTPAQVAKFAPGNQDS